MVIGQSLGRPAQHLDSECEAVLEMLWLQGDASHKQVAGGRRSRRAWSDKHSKERYRRQDPWH